MRLFLGLNLAPSLKDSIYRYFLPMHESIKGWESAHDYHQTLLFIGEVDKLLASEIAKRMETIKFHPFRLNIDGVKFFNRRIMYLSINPSHDLLELKRIINDSFPEWVKLETKTFHPHITIKRWQRYEYDHLLEAISNAKRPSWEFDVRGLSLFKSEKNHLNQKYHEIKYVDFKHEVKNEKL